MMHSWTSFTDACKAFGLAVGQTQTGQLERYYDLLVLRNRQMNLTAITAFEEAQVLHFLDSAASGFFYQKEFADGERLIDVGTGAGFPGLVLKILFPALQITLLDAQKKRTEFLKEVTGELALTGITVIHGRAEDIAKDAAHRECYDIACARAVSALRILAEYLLPFVKTGGFALAYKTPDDGTECREAENAVRILGGEAPDINDYVLPGTGITRRLVRINKRENTPARYPRRTGMPEKRPL